MTEHEAGDAAEKRDHRFALDYPQKAKQGGGQHDHDDGRQLGNVGLAQDPGNARGGQVALLEHGYVDDGRAANHNRKGDQQELSKLVDERQQLGGHAIGHRWSPSALAAKLSDAQRSRQ